MRKLINVFTCYDTNKTVIARIVDREAISYKQYKHLLTLRTVGGTAGIYTDADHDITVSGPDGRPDFTIIGKPEQ